MIALPKTVGVIGAGNMAEALLRGLLRAGMAGDQLIVSDVDAERLEHVARDLGVRTTLSNAEVAASSQLVVLAVKPQHAESATATLRNGRADPLYVSICAGLSTGTLRGLLGEGARVVRAMPNTPALIGAGITAVASDSGLAPEDLERASAVLAAIGEVVHVPEAQLDAVTGLSGSGPAYVYTVIEALTAGGVAQGLPAPVARKLATATTIGAAQMVRDTGVHPAALRDQVSSPGGTTIAGLAALERSGLRAALMEAVAAATRRSRELSGGD